MTTDGIIISLEERKKLGGKAACVVAGGPPSEDAVALAFVRLHGSHFRYVPAWRRWIAWDGKRWVIDHDGTVFALIRTIVRGAVAGTRHERRVATANTVAGVERMARYDPAVVIQPDALDADPWVLNTQSGIVDLRDGNRRPYDPAALMTRMTAAAPADAEGEALWSRFLVDITQGDSELSAYLQRLAGYCATGVTSEDILPYLFGVGSNGKSSFAEALTAAPGDYALVFAPEVMMEAKGERHPTELAQFMGVRLALCSEPSSSATWNDSRVKSLTGDATLSARFMRGDHFTFRRGHKTIVVGNHMPRLNAVTPAIRRRMQMVPFCAVFTPVAGQGMRERLQEKALGAVLAWAIKGTVEWANHGTAPPASVRLLTDEYLGDEDGFGQWLEECCARDESGIERSSDLHRNYHEADAWWCDLWHQGPRIRKSTGTIDRREAQEYADRLKAELWRHARLGERPTVTWDAAVLDWLDAHTHLRTLSDRKDQLRFASKWLKGKSLAAIDRDTLDAVGKKKAATGVGPATVNRHLAAISAVLGHAFKKGWLPSKPSIPKRHEPENVSAGRPKTRRESSLPHYRVTWRPWRNSRSPLGFGSPT